MPHPITSLVDEGQGVQEEEGPAGVHQMVEPEAALTLVFLKHPSLQPFSLRANNTGSCGS